MTTGVRILLRQAPAIVVFFLTSTAALAGFEDDHLYATDFGLGDRLGTEVSISGDVAVIAAPRDEIGGVGGFTGSVYVFRFNGSSWVEEAKLVASDSMTGWFLGWSVSVSGNVILVGSPFAESLGVGTGATYVFRYNGADWIEEAKLTASDGFSGDDFGVSVSVAGDTAVIGASEDSEVAQRSGSAYVFRYNGVSWIEEAKLTASDGAAFDDFGRSVSISGSSDVVMVGAPDDDDAAFSSGSAYLFRYNGSNWVEEAKITASDAELNDKFGDPVSVSGGAALIGVEFAEPGGLSLGAAYVFRFNGSNWIQEVKLLASDGSSGDSFGIAASLDGDVAVIGADGVDLNGPGMSGSPIGAAYVYRHDGSNWVEEAKLTASDAQVGDFLGRAVSISGNRFLAGAPFDDDDGSNSGSSYVFEYSGSSWLEDQKLTAADTGTGDFLGTSSSISVGVALFGAEGDADNGAGSGAAYAFRFDGSAWSNPLKIKPSDGMTDDSFGISVSTSGDTALIGADGVDDYGLDSGAAYVFEYNGSGWVEQQKLVASDSATGDFYGVSVALDGTAALIGAFNDDDNGPDSGSAYVFRDNGTSWIEGAKLTASDGAATDWFGRSVSLYGDVALVGADGDSDNGTNSGSAYVFRYNGISWIEEAKLTASDGAAGDSFGFSVSLFGDRALVGAYLDDDNGNQAGSAYVFHYDGSTWTEEEKLLPLDGESQNNFGYSVSISDRTALVGAYRDNDSGTESGSAYVFFRNGGNWIEGEKLTASDGEAGDFLGASASVFGDTAVVGAFGTDDFGYIDSGSIYLFDVPVQEFPQVPSIGSLGMALVGGLVVLAGYRGLRAQRTPPSGAF